MADTADTIDRAHPIAVLVSRFDDDLKTLRDQPAWSMGPAETRQVMVELTRLEAQVAELRTRVVAHGQSHRGRDRLRCLQYGELARARHPPDPGRCAPHDQAGRRALGTEVHEPVRLALADGALLVDQAEVIIAAVDALPTDLVDEDLRAEAQATLIDYAAHHDAKALRILGRRILDVIAPEIGEAHEARQSSRRKRPTPKPPRPSGCSDDGHGKCHGRFTVPTCTARSSARRSWRSPPPSTAPRSTDTHPNRVAPAPTRWVRRSCEYIARYPAEDLPHAGGVNATVVVTMDLSNLDGWAEGSAARHRPPHLTRARPPTGLRGRDHPRRPRRQLPGPRPRSQDPVLHQGPADRPRDRSRAAAPPKAATGHPA